MTEIKTIEISIDEYERLMNREEKLCALENGGVDNWEWYEESMKNYFGEDNE